MRVHNVQGDISMVILADFSPGILSPKWLFSRNVITKQEWEEQDEKLLVAPPTSHFKLGNSIEWFCEEQRLQIRSLDITKSNRMIDFLLSIFNVLPELNFHAIGINAGLQFFPITEEDSIKFSNQLSNNAFMDKFLTNPKSRSITFQENVEATTETPQRTITFSQIGEENYEIENPKNHKKTNVILPIWSINMNNHFLVSSVCEAICVVKKAEVIHADFRDMCEHLFAKI